MGADGAQPDPSVVLSPGPGNVYAIDERGLVEVARRGDCVLEVLPAMGDFVPTRAPLLRIHGDRARVDVRAALRQIGIGPERTHHDDLMYGLRKLVDIAERGIAQPFADPTTTTQAIHRINDCLRQLAPRPFPSGRRHDADGNLRLIVRPVAWEAYVRLAFDELRLAGAATPQVSRRLRAALEDLKTVAPPERRAVLDLELELLEAAVRRAYEDEEDVIAANTPDQQGIGSGPDLVQPSSVAVNAR